MSEFTAEVLRAELRHGRDPDVKRRRGIVALSLFSGTILGGVALFQMGMLRRLPELPGEMFDADAVHGSLKAYSDFGTPDALLGLVSYAVTACLAGAGALDRRKKFRLIPLAMGAKVMLDTAFAGNLELKGWRKMRKLSVWSLLISGATLGSLVLAMPEVKKALRGPDFFRTA